MLQQTQRNVHTCVHVCTHVHDPIASSSFHNGCIEHNGCIGIHGKSLQLQVQLKAAQTLENADNSSGQSSHDLAPHDLCKI
mmetsp:Transcript_41514/g.69350  ORF Transcript_41514/g.69350 Transcript_41514/m.69350 type:complete len:81 (-) Transcript_41514:128-370(-)